ncbi:hypothetical protein OG204_32110 [Streptomyces sp. NBC_01387]|uniref:hypothetical protein n=1 Tax=Streptomyces sp. NBC_01387 TaxID=2903849 RepID=UPI003251F7AB
MSRHLDGHTGEPPRAYGGGGGKVDQSRRAARRTARLSTAAATAALTAAAALGVMSPAQAATASRPASHSRSGASASRVSPAPPAVQVRRGGPARSVAFSTARTGEAVLTLDSSAPGVSWQTRGSESAVVSVSTDGRYTTDVVIPSGEPLTRSFTLGHLRAGHHTLRLAFAADRSPAGATRALLGSLAVSVTPEDTDAGTVLRNAPVLYGRNIPALGTEFQSATTDTPLVMWHESLPSAVPGHRVLQYSVIWSNEDGGTDSPALMARWGRTTDIEWVYRTEIDAHGRRVPGTGVYQAPDHQTLRFAGEFDGDRPLLETCTSNNNMCDSVDDPMRFSLSPAQDLPAGQPREHLMDTNAWTYPVMAQEMVREGRTESPTDPSTPEVGDQRDYLYIAVAHTAASAGATGDVGLTVGVRLRGGDTVYRSDHAVPTSSVNRDGTAATTVELPPGTTAADIAEITAIRTPVGASEATLDVTAVTRAFFLGRDYLPTASFADWSGKVSLSPAGPSAVLWRPAGG